MKYICEGKRVFAQSVRKELLDKIDALREKGAMDDGNDPLSKKLREKINSLDGMKHQHDELYLGRKGCGEDLTSQVESIPADGEEYEYECPKCGNKGSMKKMPVA